MEYILKAKYKGKGGGRFISYTRGSAQGGGVIKFKTRKEARKIANQLAPNFNTKIQSFKTGKHPKKKPTKRKTNIGLTTRDLFGF